MVRLAASCFGFQGPRLANPRGIWPGASLFAYNERKSVGFERAMEHLDVRTIASLHRADCMNGTDIRSTEGAIVGDVLDARPAIGDNAAKFGEPAGAITDDRR